MMIVEGLQEFIGTIGEGLKELISTEPFSKPLVWVVIILIVIFKIAVLVSDN